ncbi:MAG: cell division protein ZapA [Halieaceae bacterium]|nr:cell division protein ZapA [Halieaceae bacterium]MCP4467987.1 cell division protein ZapA [Halieaceae bacterium]MCP4841663.1 cell division protein ZapA [Halieaceae bacterium]
MSNKNNTVTVKILEKDYQVACPEEQEAQLIMSAKYLDKQMRGIRDSGKVIGLERIAVMAALNIGYELLSATDGNNSTQPGTESVKRINHKLDEALHDLRQLEIG